MQQPSVSAQQVIGLLVLDMGIGVLRILSTLGLIDGSKLISISQPCPILKREQTASFTAPAAVPSDIQSVCHLTLTHKANLPILLHQKSKFLSPSLTITRPKNWEHVQRSKIRIGDKAWIGFNSIILKGVTIGEGAVIAAGSIVIHDVPEWSVVGGNPAKVIRLIPNAA